MGCMGPNGGPYWNLPQPPPCATGPNKDPTSTDDPALPLYNATKNCGGGSCNTQIVQQPLLENQLDSNYVDYLTSYFQQHSAPGANPFFAYMAFSHTHVPLFFDPKFANSSSRKTIFADTVMEFDDSVNRIIKALHTYGLAENTLVLATSDVSFFYTLSTHIVTFLCYSLFSIYSSLYDNSNLSFFILFISEWTLEG